MIPIPKIQDIKKKIKMYENQNKLIDKNGKMKKEIKKWKMIKKQVNYNKSNKDNE